MNFQDDFKEGTEFFFTSDNGYWKGIVLDKEFVLDSPNPVQRTYADIAIEPQEEQSAIVINSKQATLTDPERDVTRYDDAPVYSVTVNKHRYGLKADELVHNKPYEKTCYTNGVLTYCEKRTTESYILHVEVLEYEGGVE